MLLFDQNLAPRLVFALQDCFQGAIHVQEVGLAAAEDSLIWRFAADHGLAIVTKDGDFRQRSFLEGHPPKIIWIALGNCSTNSIEAILRLRREEIGIFLQEEQSSLLTIS